MQKKENEREIELCRIIADLSNKLAVKEKAYFMALDTINDLKRENANLTLKLRITQGK